MNTNGITLRPVGKGDAAVLGTICYEAFKTISEAHSFPPDFPAPEHAIGLVEMLATLPDVYGVAAESHGKLVGSNFLWATDPVAGIGPITIDPASQDSSVGRQLMEDVIQYSDEKGHLSVRLVQAAWHNRSLSLYTKLGFNTVEPLSLMQGPPLSSAVEGYAVRVMTLDDAASADAVSMRVHGHSRRNEIAGAAARGVGTVVEHDGRVTGYSTTVGFFGHTVGESNEDLKALIGAASEFAGSGFLLPTRNSELMRWCLDKGLRVIQPMTLMSRGFYQEPRGAFMPSILF